MGVPVFVQIPLGGVGLKGKHKENQTLFGSFFDTYHERDGKVHLPLTLWQNHPAWMLWHLSDSVFWKC